MPDACVVELSPDKPNVYLVCKEFSSLTQTEEIIKLFKCPTSPLRIVVATIAFGMGIDCRDVRQIIHVGPPEDIETYIQHIGRSGLGRDMHPSCVHGPKLMKYSSKYMTAYCRQNSLCRRNYLF